MKIKLLAALVLLSALSYPFLTRGVDTVTAASAESGGQPVRPAVTEPAATEPEPAATEPAATEPEPAATEPAATEPAATEPEPAATEPVVTEPAPLLVNKSHALAADYVPRGLRAAEIQFSFDEDAPRRKMRDEAAGAVERLFAQAIFADATERYGSEEASNPAPLSETR